MGLLVRDQFVHEALTTEATDQHAAVLLAVRRERPRAAEAAMRALVERSIDDVLAAQAAEPGRGTTRSAALARAAADPVRPPGHHPLAGHPAGNHRDTGTDHQATPH